MNPREKIITQCVLCCLVFVCAKGISFLPNEQVQKAQATVQRQLETHYTEDDWKRFASGFCRKIKKTPLAIANAVARANSADSANSADEMSSIRRAAESKTTRPVYAPADGIVLTSGIDKNLGMIVKIQHEKQISTCGNLCRVTVVQNDSVKKGDVIGYYEKTCGKDFYYDKEENYRN